MNQLIKQSPVLRRLRTIIWDDSRVRCSLFAFSLPNCSIPIAVALFDVLPTFFLIHHALLGILCFYALPTSRSRLIWKYSAQSFALGLVNGWAIALMLKNGTTQLATSIFCLYLCVFTLFHFSEFLLTALTNIGSLQSDSFLLNHSLEYWIAIAISWAEFWSRAWLVPSFCCAPFISFLGISCCIVGELFRKLAMCHASIGFTHQIAVQKHRHHQLCTSGVYSLVRHPGYMGWLIWAVGTQLILCNPICLPLYAYAAFRFFEGRIWEEERYLIDFFGQRYIAYQRRVPSGIIKVQGYQPPI